MSNNNHIPFFYQNLKTDELKVNNIKSNDIEVDNLKMLKDIEVEVNTFSCIPIQNENFLSNTFYKPISTILKNEE